jgi:hypothetical protein
MGFVLGCCLGRPPPARACTNRGICCHKLLCTVSGEPQGLVCCAQQNVLTHGAWPIQQRSNEKRNTATTHKYQPPRASVCQQPKPLPMGVTGRNIEDTQPLPPHSYPKYPKTAPRPVPPTRPNTPKKNANERGPIHAVGVWWPTDLLNGHKRGLMCRNCSRCTWNSRK